MTRSSLSLILAQEVAEATRAAQQMRDRYVRAAGRDGWSVVRIASVTGLTPAEVSEIVDAVGDEE